MLTINPLIAKRREFTGSLARLPKLRAGERLFVKRTNPVPIDAEETLTDLPPTSADVPRRRKRPKMNLLSH